MKRILPLFALLAAGVATAQTMVKEMDGAYTRFIPGCYMKSGEAAIYFSSDEYGYSDGQTCYEAEIYDFELKPLKSFNFQVLHPYTIYEQRASHGTKELTRTITQSRSMISGLPDVSDMDARKDAFITWFYDQNKYLDPTLTIEALTSGCSIQGSTIYISLPINTDYGYYQYAEYLKTLQVYFDESDTYGYNYIYTHTVPVYDGEWNITTWYDVPVSNFCTPKCTDVAKMNHWNGGVYLPFSQTFFNDDEKFEYVRYKAEIVEGYGSSQSIEAAGDPLEILFGITGSDRDGDGEVDYRATRYGVKRSGLEVVSEDGSVIYTFPLPETCENNPHIEFFKSDNSILAQIDFDWRDENNNYIHTVRFYRLDKSAGETTVIREENRMSASPNPVPTGTPVRLTVPAGDNGNRIVSVSSLSGVQLYSTTIDADTTELHIPTQNLTAGIYLFSLSENNNLISTCKIIVR